MLGLERSEFLVRGAQRKHVVNSEQPVFCGLQVVVDDAEIEKIGLSKFCHSRFEPPFDDFRGVCFPSAQTGFENFHRRGGNEDAPRLRIVRFEKPRALHVDVEEDVKAFVDIGFDHGVRRAVIVAENRSKFGEFVAFYSFFEFGDRDEIVFDAVAFFPARRARRRGSRQPAILPHRHEVIEERRFSGARRTDGDEHVRSDAVVRF